MITELTAAGIDPFDEGVYRAILARHTAAPQNSPPNSATPRIGSPARWTGCATTGWSAGSPGTRRRYAAIEPRAAMEALIRASTAELDQGQERGDQLALLFAGAHGRRHRRVEIVTGSEALGRWFVRCSSRPARRSSPSTGRRTR